MTLIREPGTVEHAIHKAACDLTADGESGYDILARALGLASGNLVRKWSNPNQPERPSLLQCLVIDQVYVNRSCGTPPIHAVYEARLEAATSQRPPHVAEDPLHRITKTMKEVSEGIERFGELVKAGKASPNCLFELERELQEAADQIEGMRRDARALYPITEVPA
ncbi:phage regulatory CII family protein [Denitrobaculum tricleocarpae]|uniref:Uncharacterized protein n=1 Tax=Denitrobaculum tricleocarpae TaxID=2591009 RepID=A0A545TSZ3_9PROT|nr:phage regulatory CII family protein [Denitrobaculum tricleocarpae]TQV80340.1 hypothetical protein FKG95_09095 [Denitrobaculum tricleocarpae]